MKKSERAGILVGILLALLATRSVLAEKNTDPPASLQELKESITEIMYRHNVHAVGIAMLDRNGPVWVGALGKANLENNVDADENSLFRIASTSKMFVALSVLKLVEEGRLSLDEKLTDLAPEVAFENRWEANHPVRLVHLLEHTTGWDELHYPEFAQNDPTPSTLKKDLDFHPHSRRSRWVPGTRFSYTNSGPAVAAYIVEKTTGQSFESYVQEHFFDPIGMTSASYFLSDAVKTRGVTSYAGDDRPLDYWHFFMRPSSSINASSRDMAQFLRFYLNRGWVNGKQVLTEESLTRMETVKSTNGAEAGQQAGYGLNNYTSFYKQWVYRAHNGGFDAAMSEFAYLPEAKLGHAIMISSKSPGAFRKITDLVRGYETRNLADKVIENDQVVTAEHREIEGLYYPINPRLQKLSFLFHFMRVRRFSFDGDTLVQSGLLGGKTRYYYPVTASLYKSKENGVTSLSKVTDPLAGEVLHDSSSDAGSANNTVLKPMYSWMGYSQLIIEVLWMIVVVSSVAYFMIWSVRRLLGRIPAGATIRVRLWPLLASMSILLTVLLLVAASGNHYKYLGQPTAISVGIMAATASFAVFSLLAVITVYKERKTPMNRANYWYSACSAVVHLLMSLYMFRFGVIGIRFWT